MDAVRTIAPTYGLSPVALGAARVAAVRSQARGATVVEVSQRVGGVDVLHAKLKLLFARDGRFVAAGGRLAADAREAPAVAAPLDASAAIGVALGHLGAPIPAGSIAPAGTHRGLFDDYTAPGLTTPARARPVLVESASGLVPAFHLEVFARVAGVDKAARYVVSGATGAILESSSLVRHAPFGYRVWAAPDGDHHPATGPHEDFSPHPTGVPDQSFPAPIPPSLVTIDGFNVHQDPWLPAGALSSKGNNVDAYTDDGAPDGFSGAPDIRATPTAGAFDFTYDLLQSPLANDTQRMASVTAAFYTLNWLHDEWYDAGFDEQAGNAQASNLGRGGVEGDVLLVEVQDNAPSSLDNANASVPSDGMSPRIQIFLWSAKSATEPLRDGALDNLVVAHEWGHYLHQRLNDCSSHQCGAESEGWGDYVALTVAVQEGDDLGGVYSDSTYADAASSEDVAYFGTRRFPYTADMSKNPLTFQHISAGVALPTTAPINGSVTSPNEEVHAAGEVWGQMMFEAHLALLGNATKPNAPYTFAEARKRMESYVVTGLQLAPDSPTYTEQRDAILAAAAANDPADALLIAQAFAKRGAGTCAVSPPASSDDLTGVVESFLIAPNPTITSVTLTDDTTSCDDDGYLDDDETGTVRVTIENPSPAALTDGTVTLASDDGAVTFPAGASIAVPTIAPFGSTTMTIPVARSGAPKVVAEISATLAAPSACVPTSTVTTAFAVSVDEGKTSSDGFEAMASTWSLDGDGADESWSLGPIGAANHGWRGRDADVLSDRSLVSPPIALAAGANLVVGFSHAYSFEESQDTYWDGGVVEISKDGGPWEDASKYANPAYVADIGGNGENPLFGRPAFVGESESYPVPAPETLTFGTSFGGSTVKLRFRIGTDTAVGADGWIIDDVIVAGAASPPFVGLVADACAPPSPATTSVASSSASSTGAGGDGGGGGSPDDDDGCGCVVAAEPSSFRPTVVLLGIALGAMRARRRRSAQKQS